MLAYLSEKALQGVFHAAGENSTQLGEKIREALETIEAILEEDGYGIFIISAHLHPISSGLLFKRMIQTSRLLGCRIDMIYQGRRSGNQL